MAGINDAVGFFISQAGARGMCHSNGPKAMGRHLDHATKRNDHAALAAVMFTESQLAMVSDLTYSNACADMAATCQTIALKSHWQTEAYARDSRGKDVTTARDLLWFW